MTKGATSRDHPIYHTLDSENPGGFSGGISFHLKFARKLSHQFHNINLMQRYRW
jgi:hypothetical protein